MHAPAKSPAEILEPHARKSVKTVVEAEGEACDAIFEIAMGSKRRWTYSEVVDLEIKLSDCNQKVGDWLKGRTA